MGKVNIVKRFTAKFFYLQIKLKIWLIFLKIAVSKENDIFQIAKKTIRDGRLALPDLKNEFC